mmetsp:Transcript_39361/g.29072  ORF Transcript_39361/g.29072 Transcript_39361/m.29072 type:complete len:102 (-) Transcript_39361:57-362(-)
MAAKWNPELLGTTPKEIADGDMLYGVLMTTSKLKMTHMSYHGEFVKSDLAALAHESMEPYVKFLGDKKFILGDNVTWMDFVTLEYFLLLDFITDGEFKKRN